MLSRIPRASQDKSEHLSEILPLRQLAPINLANDRFGSIAVIWETSDFADLPGVQRSTQRKTEQSADLSRARQIRAAAHRLEGLRVGR